MLQNSQIQLGIAPIAWTNDDLPELGGHISLDQCLDEMAEANYVGCELGNKFPRDPVHLKQYLEPRKLQLASGWFSTFFTEDRAEETEAAFVQHRDFLKAMGSSFIIVCECGHAVQGKPVPIFEAQPQFSELQWNDLAQGLETLGRLAQEKDMVLVYHHHMGTGTQSRSEVDRLMAMTDPQWVSLLLDTGHMTYAGDDPLGVAKDHGDRIKYVHLKDIRSDILKQVHQQKMSFLDSVKAGVFTVPGDGMVKFEPIFDWFQSLDYSGWYIVEAEQDPDQANPLEYAQMARSYLQKTLGI